MARRKPRWSRTPTIPPRSDTSYALDCDPKPIIGDPTTPNPTATVYWTVDNLTVDSLPFTIDFHHTTLET